MLIRKQWAFVLFVLGYMSYNYGARYVQSCVKLFRVFISDENAKISNGMTVAFANRCNCYGRSSKTVLNSHVYAFSFA